MIDTPLRDNPLHAPLEARPRVSPPADAAAGASAVSWAAIFAGAAGAAGLSLILLSLGTGFGLLSISPFRGDGVEAQTFGVSTIAWLTLTQLAASGTGGYLAGRLRTRWISTHSDEVYFRDTAHGLIAWAISTLATAAMLTSFVGALVGAGAATVGAAGAGAATAAVAAAPAAAGAMKEGAGGSGYFVDALFRPAAPSPTDGTTAGSAAPSATASNGTDSAPSTAEAGRILASGLASGSLPANDSTYLAQLVSQRTGLSQAEADRRVNDVFTRMKAKADQAKAQAQQAADQARKASAYAMLWLAITLLLGAFVASFAATFGGRQRDRV